MKIRSRTSMGFRLAPIYRRKNFNVLRYLSRRFAFWTAVFSLFAFAMGNLVGQHGINAVWHAAFGGVDDSLITYDGTVAPVRVPDYSRLNAMTGDITYTQIPHDALRDLPRYDAKKVSAGEMVSVYSVGYMGSYTHGGHGDGSHAGTDIRAPYGTPVVSAMNGLVVRAEYDTGGFGNVVVIKTVNAPDPRSPSKGITIFTGYAHMSSMEVSVGDVVKKGQLIGAVGATGFATGNHLHFQIDRSYLADGKEGYHPLWPFTAAEVRDAGLTFLEAVDTGLNKDKGYALTIDPVTYIQSAYAPVASGIASNDQKVPEREMTTVERRDARLQARLDRRAQETVTEPVVHESAPSVLGAANTVVSADVSATPAPPVPAPSTTSSSTFSRVEFQTDGGITPRRTWRTIELRFFDADGKIVTNPDFQALYPRATFGQAIEFRPAIIKPEHARNGTVTLEVLSNTPTLIVQLQPFTFTSPPLRFEQ